MASLRVKVEQGELQGCAKKTDDGFEYNSFLGIPYAKPPLGNLRFKDPQPAEKWSGVRDASNFGSLAPQNDFLIKKEYLGEEDCLSLNIYVPTSASNNKNLPVMVWIHGGAFLVGSGNADLYGPEYLLPRDVVLVTFNYRLGPFGFLCLNTPEVPGNAAMKDQVLALKWVKKNIAFFGGDPDNVTIFGESAGSISVTHLVLSRMTEGLFRRAILQSGSAIGPWGIQQNPEKIAFDLAKSFGLETDDKEEVLAFLRKIPAEQMVEKTKTTCSLDETFVFLPVVEREFTNVEPFLKKDPLELMKAGDFNRVPMMCGYNSKEGYLFINTSIKNAFKIENKEDLRKKLSIVLSILEIKYTFKRADVIDKIEEFYFSNSYNLIDDYMEVIGDIAFVIDLDLLMRTMSKFSPMIYFYYFCYEGDNNLFKNLTCYPYKGACHGDELGYIFKSGMPSTNEWNVSDMTTRDRMLELWTNFAKYGNPTPRCNNIIKTIWKPVKGDEINCLQIDDELNMVIDPRAKNIAFWKSILTLK